MENIDFQWITPQTSKQPCPKIASKVKKIIAQPLCKEAHLVDPDKTDQAAVATFITTN